MKQVWVYVDEWNDELEFYDCKETAQLAYNKWCELHNETPTEETFNLCYYPFSEVFKIITADKIVTAEQVAKDDFNPA